MLFCSQLLIMGGHHTDFWIIIIIITYAVKGKGQSRGEREDGREDGRRKEEKREARRRKKREMGRVDTDGGLSWCKCWLAGKIKIVRMNFAQLFLLQHIVMCVFCGVYQTDFTVGISNSTCYSCMAWKCNKKWALQYDKYHYHQYQCLQYQHWWYWYWWYWYLWGPKYQNCKYQYLHGFPQFWHNTCDKALWQQQVKDRDWATTKKKKNFCEENFISILILHLLYYI